MKVTLNVGGTLFVTTDQTLTAKSQYFRVLLGSDFKSYFDKDDKQIEEIFIDRDPDSFKHILSYLWDSNYKISRKYEFELLF
jgi:hypothetical protein